MTRRFRRTRRVPAAAVRREDALVLAGTLGTALLGLLVLLGVGLPKLILEALLLAGAAIAAWQPEIGLYALIVNALIGLTHMASLPRLGPLSVPVAFEAVLLLSLAARAVFFRRKLFLAAPQHILALALAAWMILSLLYNGRARAENLSDVRNLFLVRIFVFFLLTNILLTKEALKRMMVILMACNAGLLATSFLAREGVFGAERLTFSDKLLRTSGIVHNPNTLAFDLTTMLIFAIAAFLYVRSPLLKLVLAALAAGDILAILTTLSRSGFVSLCVVLLFILWKMRRDWRGVALAGALAIAVLLLFPSGLEFRFSRVEEIQDVNRLTFAKVALNMAVQNPVFGVGFGSYLEEFDRYNNTDLDWPCSPHNMYLSLAAEVGFPALILYLMIFGILWRRLLSMERDLRSAGAQGSFLYQFGWAVQAALVNLAVFGLSGDVAFEYSVFTVLGFGMLLYREHGRPPGERFEGAPHWMRPARRKRAPGRRPAKPPIA